MVTAVIQFNGVLFTSGNGKYHSWDGANAGYHFISYNNEHIGRASFRPYHYGTLKSFYSRRHCTNFKLILEYN